MTPGLDRTTNSSNNRVSEIRYQFRKQLAKVQPMRNSLFTLSYIFTDSGPIRP